MTAVIARVVRSFSYIGAGVLFVLMCLVTLDVGGRYLFNKPIKGGLEFNELGLAIVVCLSLSYTALHKGHVSIGLLVDRFPAKVRAGLDIFASIIGVAAFAMIAWQGVDGALSAMVNNKVTDALGLPTYPVRLFIPLGAVLLCLVLIDQMISSVRSLRQGGR